MARDKGRPPLSGSNSRSCRLKLWLANHGYEEEATLPGTQRTFDMGHIIEAAMFRGIGVPTGNMLPHFDAAEGMGKGFLVDPDGRAQPIMVPEMMLVGPWWKDLGEVRDHATGKSFTANMEQLSDFQRTVKFAGLEGHIDALVRLESGLYVPDVKSTQGFGYDRHLTGNLEDDVFAKAYIGQLHFYIAGLREEGLDIAGGLLIFFNKENSQVMARFVDYNPAITEEILERIAAARADAEPEPDYEWTRGSPIPLACRYCSYRTPCSETRGISIVQSFDRKNKPVWTAA